MEYKRKKGREKFVLVSLVWLKGNWKEKNVCQCNQIENMVCPINLDKYKNCIFHSYTYL